MSVDFFNPKCQTKLSDFEFGICDDKNSQPAYIDTNDKNKWIAIVENKNKQEIIFTAIDNCIPIHKDNGNMDSRCDGMLTYANNIVFVELKVVGKKSWITSGIEQLKNTIDIFFKNNVKEDFKKKRAFLANKKKPYFPYSQKEQMQKFWKETSVKLFIQITIKI